MDTCLLYLIRHGTTTLNVEKPVPGAPGIYRSTHRATRDAVDRSPATSPVRALAAVYTGPAAPDDRHRTDHRRLRARVAGHPHPAWAEQCRLRRLGRA